MFFDSTAVLPAFTLEARFGFRRK